MLLEKVSLAKPRSSRNSSIEAFVIGEHFNPDKIKSVEHFKNMKSESIQSIEGMVYGLDNIPNFNEFHHAVNFVSCGDLSGYDSNKNYPLEKDKEGKEKYTAPIQPPINPDYKDSIESKKK